MSKNILAAVFFSGMCIMAVEMSASRLLAPFFGSSLFVWTNLIAIVMLMLAVGYSFGGMIADRWPHEKLFFKLLMASGAYICLMPFFLKPIMGFGQIGFSMNSLIVFYSALVLTIILISLPLAVLGMSVPFAVKLTADKKKLGTSSGFVYSLSTFGSIIGTVLPAFLLIPLAGTKNTIIIFGAILVFVGIIGVGKKILLPFGALLLVLLFTTSSIRQSKNIVFEKETVHSYILVEKHENSYWLRLNEGYGVHSIYNPNSIYAGGSWDFFTLMPLFRNVDSALVLGLGAGTISRQFYYIYPEVKIDGVEIDKGIVDAGFEYFDLPHENLDVKIDDARVFLLSSDKKYGLIMADAYNSPYIPWHLTTREFFGLCRERLDDEGIFALNLLARKDSDLYDGVLNTLSSEFKHVYVMQIQGSINHIVYASNEDYDPSMIDANSLASQRLRMYRVLVENTKKVVHDPQKTIFTDDKTASELFTNRMIIKDMI